MKNILLTAAWEIFDLSAANNVDIGIARDMFCENLSTYQPSKSAYQAEVDGGYTGTESEFNSLLANGGLLCENLKIKRR